jgi:hypothetical protein
MVESNQAVKVADGITTIRIHYFLPQKTMVPSFYS